MPRTRALVVDDDEVTRRLVSRYLDDDPNIEVVLCDSGEKALSRLNDGEKFDWLILDWSMPRLSGYQVLCALRSDTRFSQTRVLMLTAMNSMENVKQALAAGANEYLMKPFTKEMLMEKLALLDLR